MILEDGKPGTIIRTDPVPGLEPWGFHYPLTTYAPNCTGLFIVDARKGQPTPEHEVLYEAKKYKRIAFNYDDFCLFQMDA